MEDLIAISRLKQGDLNGLETLVSRYQVRAVRAAYLILYDRSLAEDVVQTAFVKAAQRIHQFDDGRPFGPWFSRIVVNDALKLATKQERSISLDEHLDDSTVQLAKWLAAGFGSFLIGFMIWIPTSPGGVLCDPNSWIQGHAFWHFLVGLATFLLYIYARTEVGKPDERTP